MIGFLIKKCGFSWCASTKAAQDLAPNADTLSEELLQRIASAVSLNNIPPERMYMADETFLFHAPESKYGFPPRVTCTEFTYGRHCSCNTLASLSSIVVTT